MEKAIENKELYTEDEARKLLGDIGKTKFATYKKMGCIVPFRTRPSLYLGEDIERAKERIMQIRRDEYGIRSNN